MAFLHQIYEWYEPCNSLSERSQQELKRVQMEKVQIRKEESRQKRWNYITDFAAGRKNTEAIRKDIERSWERRACHQLQHLHIHQHCCCCCSPSDVEDPFELMTVRVYRPIMPTGCLETGPSSHSEEKAGQVLLVLNISSDQCCFWLCVLLKALYLIWTVCFVIMSHAIECCSDDVFF